ncbi:hypothetical protein H4R34_004681 [Dimargaris verticillata]|uniref:C3H1-type domain-containing protein n=1 Tax=Dimargaris verticillata TaxID=2761393 RepID=A0A9W8AZP2_9FUNG|nr:hypothetical protein H4R34_004681 [Dimargaris verticillata]
MSDSDTVQPFENYSYLKRDNLHPPVESQSSPPEGSAAPATSPTAEPAAAGSTLLPSRNANNDNNNHGQDPVPARPLRKKGHGALHPDEQEAIQAYRRPDGDSEFGDLLRAYEKQDRKIERKEKKREELQQQKEAELRALRKTKQKKKKKRQSAAAAASKELQSQVHQTVLDAASTDNASTQFSNESLVLAALAASLNTMNAASAPPDASGQLPTNRPSDPRLRMRPQPTVTAVPMASSASLPTLGGPADPLTQLSSILPLANAALSLPTATPTPTPMASASSLPQHRPPRSPGRPRPPRHQAPPAASQSGKQVKKVPVLCRYVKTNSCGKGDLCPFSHDLKSEKCIFYFERGGCRKGHNCPYSHSS